MVGKNESAMNLVKKNVVDHRNGSPYFNEMYEFEAGLAVANTALCCIN